MAAHKKYKQGFGSFRIKVSIQKYIKSSTDGGTYILVAE